MCTRQGGFRTRNRSVRRTAQRLHRIARRKGQKAENELKEAYRKLIAIAQASRAQAKKVVEAFSHQKLSELHSAASSSATTKGRSSRTGRASPRSRERPRSPISRTRTATPFRSLKRRVRECTQTPSGVCETAYLPECLEGGILRPSRARNYRKYA